jgi:hypothetical protein
VRIAKDEQEDSYALLGLTLTEVQAIRQALERYNTPTATSVFLVLRHELPGLGDSERPACTVGRKDDRTDMKRHGIPLIVCRGK